MNDRAWYLHIFKVSNESAQAMAAAAIGGSPGLTIHTAVDGPDHYVFVDAPDARQSGLAYKLVMCADTQAVLLHTAQGPATPTAHQGAEVVPLPIRYHDDLVG
jgi:hypothetical protein